MNFIFQLNHDNKKAKYYKPYIFEFTPSSIIKLRTRLLKAKNNEWVEIISVDLIFRIGWMKHCWFINIENIKQTNSRLIEN